jgi:hypothetical protein
MTQIFDWMETSKKGGLPKCHSRASFHRIDDPVGHVFLGIVWYGLEEKKYSSLTGQGAWAHADIYSVSLSPIAFIKAAASSIRSSSRAESLTRKTVVRYNPNNTSDENILQGAAGIERTDEYTVSYEPFSKKS